MAEGRLRRRGLRARALRRRRWRWRARVADGLVFLRYAGLRYRHDRASGMAAALGYTTLLSLVPLLAIGLAMLAAFPVFDSVRAQVLDWAFSNFVPAVGEAVRVQIERFVANAGKMTAIGVVGLALTAILLLVSIESSFNAIFRVEKARPVLAKVLVYWTVLTLGPLLIGASLSLQGYIGQTVSRSFLRLLAAPLPTLLSALAFAALFAAVPNRRVRLRDALAGGIAAGVMFALLRWGFSLFVATSKTYSGLYGAMAAVPLFLLWLFLSWAVVLAGAEITAALPEWRAGHRPGSGRKGIGGRRLTLAIEVLGVLHEGLVAGKGGVTRRTLLQRTGVAENELSEVIGRLIAAGFVLPTTGRRWVLAKDPGGVSLADLIGALDLDLSLDEVLAKDAVWRGAIAERLATADAGQRAALSISLKDILAGGGKAA